MQNILEQEYYQLSIVSDYEETEEALVSLICDASSCADYEVSDELYLSITENMNNFIEILSNPHEMKNLIESINKRIYNSIDFAILVSGINNNVFGTNSQYSICIKSKGVIKTFKIDENSIPHYMNIDNQDVEEFSIFKLDCTNLSPRTNISKTKSNMKFNEDVYPNHLRMMTTVYFKLDDATEKYGVHISPNGIIKRNV